MSAETLTINVIGADGQPEAGAKVSFDQTAVSGTTDAQGVVALPIPENSYTLNVIVESKVGKVETPFYVSDVGARKLTVDVLYLQQQLIQQDSQGDNNPVFAGMTADRPDLSGVGVLLLLILLAVAIIGSYFGYQHRKELRQRYRRWRKRRRERNTIPDMSEYFHD